MIVEGKLSLDNKNDDYRIFAGGRSVNLTEMLDEMLMGGMFIEIRDTYSGEILFSADGKLMKKKTAPKYYQYHVGKLNLDEALWNSVGRKLGIEIFRER